MGGEVKTNLSDDFKALETEMNVKHEGGQDLLPMHGFSHVAFC
jgi:hypothetical protein